MEEKKTPTATPSWASPGRRDSPCEPASAKPAPAARPRTPQRRRRRTTSTRSGTKSSPATRSGRSPRSFTATAASTWRSSTPTRTSSRTRTRSRSARSCGSPDPANRYGPHQHRGNTMKSKQWLQSFVAFAVVALVAAGCANQMEPAKKAIADIEAAVAAAGDDAAKYIPDEVSAVNDKVASLKAQFDKKDYKGVIAAAPAVLAQAQALAASAAAKKTESMDALNAEWGSLAASRAAGPRRDPEPRRHPVEVEEAARRDRQGDARIDQGGARRGQHALDAGDRGPVVGRPRAGGRAGTPDQGKGRWPARRAGHDARLNGSSSSAGTGRLRAARSFGLESPPALTTRPFEEPTLAATPARSESQARAAARSIRSTCSTCATCSPKTSAWCRIRWRASSTRACCRSSRSLRRAPLPARARAGARGARPARRLARGLRLRGPQRGELRPDLPGARARRLRHPQLRLGADEPLHVPDPRVRQRGAEAEVPAAAWRRASSSAASGSPNRTADRTRRT